MAERVAALQTAAGATALMRAVEEAAEERRVTEKRVVAQKELNTTAKKPEIAMKKT